MFSDLQRGCQNLGTSPFFDIKYLFHFFIYETFFTLLNNIHFFCALSHTWSDKDTYSVYTPSLSCFLQFCTHLFDIARCLVTSGSYMVHVLLHRTNVIILFRIVMDTLRMERVRSITGTLFFMEVIVLDKDFYSIILHEPVIFFRTVTGVRHADSR